MSAQPSGSGDTGRGGQDTVPLLEDADGGLLQRIVTRLPQPNAWRRLFPWRVTARDDAAGDSNVLSDMEAGQGPAQHAEPVGADRRTQPLSESAHQCTPAAARQANGAVPSSPGAGAAVGPRADSSVEGEIRAASSPHWQDPSGIVIAAAFASEPAPVLEDGATPPAGPRAAVEGEGDTPTTRVARSVRSLKVGASDGQESPGSKGSPGSVGASVFRSLLRGGSSGERQRMSRSDSGAQPTCLICLEPLTSEDFLSGEAISLDCQCRGDLALRHRTCAVKWSRVKGDVTCDICKSQVKNLPTPSPRAHSGSESEMGTEEFSADAAALSSLDAMPGNADMVFDCIRVTWVAMIICILAFEMSLSTALWTGIIVGIGYTLFVRAMYRQQIIQLQNEAARATNGGITPVAGAQASAPAPALQANYVMSVG